MIKLVNPLLIQKVIFYIRFYVDKNPFSFEEGFFISKNFCFKSEQTFVYNKNECFTRGSSNERTVVECEREWNTFIVGLYE
jgi:hypothetical protein